MGYVPQDAALFKTMTVRDNIAFALSVRKTPAKEIEERVNELAERFGLTQLISRLAVGLSGGESQRIALARALAFRPPVLLLDEPLNAVDEATRDRLVAVLKEVRERGDTTVLHVTHSREEADTARRSTLLLRFEGGQGNEREVVRTTRSNTRRCNYHKKSTKGTKRKQKTKAKD